MEQNEFREALEEQRRQMIDLGREVVARGGPTDSMIEAAAVHQFRAWEHQQRLKQDLCCGGTMMSNGVCYKHGGICPAWKLARGILRDGD